MSLCRCVFGHPCGISEWVERACVREVAEAIGRESGSGSSGEPAPHPEAKERALATTVPVCLDACVSFLQRFHLAVWDLLDLSHGGDCQDPIRVQSRS